MSDKEKKVFEEPKAEVVMLEEVHNAKSWNKGNGRDTTDKNKNKNKGKKNK
ncbi:MAG: hypothetical protein PHI27_07780 [Eubacteriales bacterium]|nr:hypothetical protein [Eubacteriales bacterium]MDD3882136.1 hypothetical protein [Eubacteriales bacterium]MDD4513241.1 hypothetical protein [Eubacteriales bacterium]